MSNVSVQYHPLRNKHVDNKYCVLIKYQNIFVYKDFKTCNIDLAYSILKAPRDDWHAHSYHIKIVFFLVNNISVEALKL